MGSDGVFLCYYLQGEVGVDVEQVVVQQGGIGLDDGVLVDFFEDQCQQQVDCCVGGELQEGQVDWVVVVGEQVYQQDVCVLDYCVGQLQLVVGGDLEVWVDVQQGYVEYCQ